CDVPKDPIDYHGEMEDYTVTIVAAAGVETPEANEAVAVYPNPTTGKVSLSFRSISSESLNINLYDMTGKLAARLLRAGKQDKYEYIFDLDNYHIPWGMYIMQVNNGASVSYQRITKVN